MTWRNADEAWRNGDRAWLNANDWNEICRTLVTVGLDPRSCSLDPSDLPGYEWQITHRPTGNAIYGTADPWELYDIPMRTFIFFRYTSSRSWLARNNNVRTIRKPTGRAGGDFVHWATLLEEIKRWAKEIIDNSKVRSREINLSPAPAEQLPLGKSGIAAAGESLRRNLHRNLMQSIFICYGDPDKYFAERLFDALRANGVRVFFFPKSATLGERIDSELFAQIQRHDRVLLICSRESLDRSGVLHEIRETFTRETRDGAATYLLPVTLDDYVFNGWKERQPDLARRVADRVVGNFSEAMNSQEQFEEAVVQILDVLKSKEPTH
jgi:hypothetical protein